MTLMAAIHPRAPNRFIEVSRHCHLLDFLPYHPILVRLGFSQTLLLPCHFKYRLFSDCSVRDPRFDFSIELDMASKTLRGVVKSLAKQFTMLILTQMFPHFPCYLQLIRVNVLTCEQLLIVVCIEH